MINNLLEDSLYDSDIYEVSLKTGAITPTTKDSDKSLSHPSDQGHKENSPVQSIYLQIQSYFKKDKLCDLLKYKTHELYNLIKGNIVKLSKRKYGSIFIQELCKRKKFLCPKIFEEIFFEIGNMMTDCYANYFLQKLYCYLRLEEKLKFLTQVRNNIIEICNNSIGTFAIQHIIEHMETKQEKFIIIDVFKKYDVLNVIATNYHGVQVIGKIITCFDEITIEFIYDYVFFNFKLFSRNSTGLILIKSIIHFSNTISTKLRIQSYIIVNLNLLIQDIIGNNVIQEILKVTII
jgi:hypothetical protein